MTGLSVLHLVTAEEVFFKQQIKILEEKGVECDICVVPRGEQIDGALAEKRGIKEYLQYFPKVRRHLRNGEYDLIHANYGLTAPYAITQLELPVVLTLWGSDVVGFDGLVTKACAWRCDAITVRSQEMLELLGRDDAIILPSGVDLERFRPIDQSAARDRVGWMQSGYHVLFPYAPTYERKNYPMAEAVVSAAEETIDAEIILHAISGVDHSEMPYYFNAADALLLTSKYEGSPNTVKEAMACNVPIVSTLVGDVNERLANVSPSDIGSSREELTRILSDVLLANERANGREEVTNLAWENLGDKLLQIYNSVIS